MVGQGELIELLARRARVIAWMYDVKTDCLSYCMPQQEQGFLQERGIKESKTAKEWNFLWEGPSKGCVDVHAPGRLNGALFRLTYTRLGQDGVVGFAEELSPKDGETPQGLRVDLKTLAARINAELVLLRAREKGVLFAAEIDGYGKGELANSSWKDKCFSAMETVLHAEFRDTDILGAITDTRFIVFFRGALSIDVVERRAQRFLDEFARRALDMSLPASCSIGIAVAGNELGTAEELIDAAGKALGDVVARGANHYRMYEGEKY
ncbi:MAG: diguanylate cyclase [Schwartzia sp.]|nr:diguanylate cyclase [Schwartzia sp. (in: firmicutes)]